MIPTPRGFLKKSPSPQDEAVSLHERFHPGQRPPTVHRMNTQCVFCFKGCFRENSDTVIRIFPTEPLNKRIQNKLVSGVSKSVIAGNDYRHFLILKSPYPMSAPRATPFTLLHTA